MDSIWSTALTLLAVATPLLSIATWPAILLSRKQPVVMLAWLLGVTLIPVLGPLFFILFGREHHLPRLPRKKVRADRVIAPLLDSSLDPLRRDPDRPLPLPEKVRWPFSVAQRVGSNPLTGGNRLRLLRTPEEKYEAMLADIRTAAHHVHLEYFTLRDDKTGSRLAGALTERARAGVQVRMLVDGLGSIKLSRRYISALKAEGVRFAWFHPLNPFLGRWSLNIRNHRKICLIDGRIGYLGGINLGDEHLGRLTWSGPWHDLAIRLEGPAVQSLQRVFSEDWHFSGGELLTGPEFFPEADSSPPGALVQIVNSMPSDDVVTELHQIYFSLLSSARRRAWLMTPYFLPDAIIQTALANLALGGVDVRVVVSRRIPEWLVGRAARSFFPQMVEAGVRIFRFRPDATLHAKALLVDDGPMMVGSANLDMRSFRINFETGALIHDPDFMRELEGYFQEKMHDSRELTLEHVLARGWPARTWDAVARLAAPLF